MAVSFHADRNLAIDVLQRESDYPVRILLTSEIAGWTETKSLGFASASFPLMFHEELGVTGVADKPLAFVINDRSIEHHVAEEFDGCVGNHHTMRRWFYAVCVHEMSHTILSVPYRQWCEQASVSFDDASNDERASYVEGNFGHDAEFTTGRHPWNGHELPFIRVLCHLIERTHRELPFCPGTAFNHRLYCLSPIGKYLSALRPELISAGSLRVKDKSRLRQPDRVPILEAIKAEAPQAFEQLWASDVSAWETKQASTT